jgi:xylulokinase
MSELLLGIDVGTSGAKAGVFDAEGKLLGLGRAAHGVDYPQRGWAQCDPEVWWRGILTSLAQACNEAQIKPNQIAAVGVGVLFPTVVALDANARAVYPAILYCDGRSLAQVRAIEETVGRDAYEAAIGNNLVPGTCAATSIMWLRDEQPETYTAAHSIGFANTFVTARLTGEFCVDPTTVGLSGLADVQDPWHWSEALCEKLGVDIARLPKVVGAAEVVGTVTASAAGKTGLKAGTPVVCGGGDVPVCAVGAAGGSSGTCVYIAGSTDCGTLPMPRPTGDRRWANTAYIEPGTWLGIGPTTSTGLSVEWVVREFLPEAGTHGLKRITELAAAAPPGSNRVLFLPYLQGERTPVWDPLARGVFVGLINTTTRADLARAVLEGTGFAVRQMLECVDDILGEPLAELRCVGGPTSNALWNQVKADIMQRPLDVLEFQETGTLGGALLAGLGAGLCGSFEEVMATARSAGGVRTVEPDPGNATVYADLFALYRQLYSATAEIAHGLGR